jgi:hypothetical protein
VNRKLALLECAEHRELELPTGTRAIEDLIQRVDSLHGPTPGGHDQVPALDACEFGGTIRLHRSNEDAVALRQPYSCPQAPGDAWWSDGHAEPNPGSGLASGEGIHSFPHRAVDGYGQDQSAVDPHRVDSKQPSIEVDQGTA